MDGRVTRTVAAAVLLVLASWQGGCPRPTGPEAAVGDWLAALEREDTAAARALLARPERAEADPAALDARVRGVDAAALAQAGRAAEDARVTAVEACWPFGEDTLVVAQSGDRWVLRSGLLGLYPCDTPDAALGSFLDAWERERWDVVHRLGPAAARRRTTPESLAAHLREPAVRTALDLRARAHVELVAAGAPLAWESAPDGAAASAAFGHYRARLVLEDGCWRVADL
jgi:hypothetical protein